MPLIVDYINIQRKLGFSPIILFTGKQRTGKTALAMRMAYELNKDWDPKKYMTFKIEEFAEAYDTYNKQILILDEAGVPLDPYEHASITQRVYTHIIQTQAYKSNIVFLVLPFASEIGKQHRKHINAIVEVLWRGIYKLYRTRNWYSDMSNKPPRLEVIETVRDVPLPPPHIWEWYIGAGQKEYKESIMQMQRAILDTRMKRMGEGQKEKRVYANINSTT